MKIIVNGGPVELTAGPGHVSYEEVVALAGLSGAPTVTYAGKRDGDVRRQGTMYTGCPPVVVEDGMVFNVIHTGGA